MQRRISPEKKALITDVLTVLVFAVATTGFSVALMGWFGLLHAVGPLSMLISAAIRKKTGRKPDKGGREAPREQSEK